MSKKHISILACLLALLMAFSFAACGGSPSSEAPAEEPAAEEPAAEGRTGNNDQNPDPTLQPTRQIVLAWSRLLG